MREQAVWEVRGGERLGPADFFVMAVINATPDSFYDGGRNLDPGAAAAAVQGALDAGAAIIDVGGESTRPGAADVGAAEETARVLPVIRAAAEMCRERNAGGVFQAAVSADTSKASVAVAALEAGAVIVNDISACRFDPALPEVLAQYRPGYVLMHSQGRPGTMQDDPRYGDVVDEVAAFFEERLTALTAAGLPEDRVVLDPGIGFGKTLAHNLELLGRMGEFRRLGRPLAVGVSNKSLWGGLLGLGVGERVNASMAATAVLWGKGVAVHRVHEPRLAVEALTVARALDPDRA